MAQTSRRSFLATMAAAASSALVAPALAANGRSSDSASTAPQTGASGSAGGPHQLPPLPYAYEALEPHIDVQTMRIHHDKHHAAYVDKLNAALKGHDDLAKKTIEELMRDLDSVPEQIKNDIRNNGGGHLNHSMFWTIMTPGGPQQPAEELAAAITAAFGDLETMKKQFNEAGAKRFGSGWAWVVKDKDGKLAITSTANQDSPISEGKYPILGNDVWEHAYYLKYQNRRAEYLEAWWNVVNWDKVAERFKKAKA